MEVVIAFDCEREIASRCIERLAPRDLVASRRCLLFLEVFFGLKVVSSVEPI